MQDVAHARFAAKQTALADRRKHANENVNSIDRWDDEGGAPSGSDHSAHQRLA